MEPAQLEQGQNPGWQPPSSTHSIAEFGAAGNVGSLPAPLTGPIGREPAVSALRATASGAAGVRKRAQSDSQQEGQSGAAAGASSSGQRPAKKQRADSSGGTPAADAETSEISSGNEGVAAGPASTGVPEALSEDDDALQPSGLPARSQETAAGRAETPGVGLEEPPPRPQQHHGQEEQDYAEEPEGPTELGGTVQRSVAAVVECLACDLCHCLLDDPVSSPECMHMCAAACPCHAGSPHRPTMMPAGGHAVLASPPHGQSA